MVAGFVKGTGLHTAQTRTDAKVLCSVHLREVDSWAMLGPEQQQRRLPKVVRLWPNLTSSHSACQRIDLHHPGYWSYRLRMDPRQSRSEEQCFCDRGSTSHEELRDHPGREIPKAHS